MNDAMSLGIHRLWKDAMLDWLAPRPGMRLVDVAGGTGDIAFRYLSRVKGDGHAVLDMTEDMLAEGRRRAEATAFADRLDWVVGDAMALPFADASFDAYTIAFGIRNVTRPEDALAEAFRVLRPGGRLMVLEFSRFPSRPCAGSTTATRSTSSRRSGRRWPATATATGTSSSRSAASPTRRPSRHDRRRRLRPGALSQPLDGHRRAALGLEALMRGPHNLWRLIRTGATFERTGAMKAALAALDAPPTLRARRVLGWPFQWLGLEGDPSQPPILQGADRARAGLHQVRPAALDPPRRRRPRARGRAQRAAARTSCRPSRWTRRAPRSRPSSASRSEAVFASFEPPVAAASLAQVHRATLRETGQVVAVKVLRPGIERAFLRDVDAFHFAASIIELLAPSPGGSGRARSSTTSRVVQGELDLRMEASAAAEFAANTARDLGFRVPG